MKKAPCDRCEICCEHCDCYPCLDGTCEICDPLGARARAARMIDRSGEVDQRSWLEPAPRFGLQGTPRADAGAAWRDRQ